MFVIEVIPLERGISVRTLTYYSATNYPAGTLLRVPVRSYELQGLVIGSKPVSLAKTALKTATFSLRKLPPPESSVELPAAILKTVKRLTNKYPAQIGAILYSLLPPQVREGLLPYPNTRSSNGTNDATPEILTDTTDNRYIAYKTQIRETFAHRGSVLFVVPTAAHVAYARAQLEKGIEQRVITFASTHTKKEMLRAYESFGDLRIAKVCIVTPAYAFLDREDITSIIIEESGSPHYIQNQRPYIDIREALKLHAEETKKSLLLGDILPLSDDEERRRDERYTTHGVHSTRLNFSSRLVVAEHPKKESGEAFSLFTKTLERTLTQLFENTGHAFLYSARRGLATLVTCSSCGYIFRCPDSGAPYSLLRTYKGDEEERWYISSTSGKKIRASDTCPSCDSWRLKEQGIGVQQIYDVAKNMFPKVAIVLFDHTTATTHKKACALIETFYSSKRALLIGTHMTLPYLHKAVDVSAVISYEAMRANPTWRIDENTLSTLFSLREKTQRDLIVQIRTSQDDILMCAEKGLVDQFYDGEIEIRKSLHYPPFVTFILLSFTGTKVHIEETEKLIQHTLGDTQIAFYNAPPRTAETMLRYGLIRTQAEPQKNLIERLTLLPPYIKQEINPNRIV